MSETKIKVLVAEDEVHLGQILSNFLGGRGYAVHTVTDGRAALEALRAEAYDVALLDIVMPELDGLEVLKQVRADADPPEVIIITGNGTIETAISAMKLGAYDYMAKPYRMAEIVDQGEGIRRADLPKIFEPFFTTKAPGRGTGLGLSICYAIIAEHGGRIEVDSTPGEGSVFRIILPRADKA